jgi:hypothetical protein
VACFWCCFHWFYDFYMSINNPYCYHKLNDPNLSLLRILHVYVSMKKHCNLLDLILLFFSDAEIKTLISKLVHMMRLWTNLL